MKKFMKVGALAAVGCVVMVGCASSSKLTPEQEAAVGPWRDQTQMMIDAKDPDLTATCTSGIAEIDAIANTVTPIASAVNKWMLDYIRETQADFAWNTYIGWRNGPDSGKMSPDAFKEESARQAKLACLEPGLTLNSTDANADALTVLAYRGLNLADAAAVDAFLAEKLPADMANWATALEANAGVGREGFYKAIKVEATDWTKILAPLQNNLTQLTKANTSIAAVLKKPELAAKLNPLTGGKESLAAVNRLRKQITVTLNQIPWLVDAIQSAE
ncbi:hypothetical protein [uncultured Bifidobacterium sp.]|uniref:hypothetical protein n=1 Tax=uncultured Bifidobacterium sp. TaxID=165187 RepID=UPI002632A8A2|nr:hypothetical protein [uncultured Bifidobacterium sp.]